MTNPNRNQNTAGSMAEPETKAETSKPANEMPVQLQLGRLSEKAWSDHADDTDTWHQKKTGQICRIRERR